MFVATPLLPAGQAKAFLQTAVRVFPFEHRGEAGICGDIARQWVLLFSPHSETPLRLVYWCKDTCGSRGVERDAQRVSPMEKDRDRLRGHRIGSAAFRVRTLFQGMRRRPGPGTPPTRRRVVSASKEMRW